MSQSRYCQNCKTSFNIEPDDFTFYDKIDVPAPTWCPHCRLIRRLTWRNERTLHKRTCSLCARSIIATYPENTPFPVYCRDCWFSDQWDPLSYGKEYDFSKNFFEQLHELFNDVPQIGMQVSNSPRSEYINQATHCKNCYLVTSASDNEDCFYSNRILHCKNVCDCLAVHSTENSYEVKESRDSNNLLYSDDCHGSFNLSFCYDCRNCSDCFMSSNLRSKTHVWYGEQLTREEFQKRIEKVNLGSHDEMKKYIEEYNVLKTRSITRFSKQKSTTQCSGNNIVNANNCRNSFYVSEVENASNLLFVDNAKDVYDTNNGCCTMERIYEVNTTGINVSDIRFSSDAWPEIQNATYTISCRNGAHDLFGCIGVQKKSYCILNKQYTQDEYKDLVTKIKKHMSDMPYIDANGCSYAFGEFFPPELSPFAFNESAAYTYTSLPKEKVIEYGWRWKELETKGYVPTISSADLPDDIKNVPDSITQEIIACEHQGACDEQCPGAFRIIPTELEFYRAKNLPLPRLCPNCRHYQRVKQMPVFQLYARKCMCQKNNHNHDNECMNTFETSYSLGRPEAIYCEQCYQKEVL